jgi:G3E family GTPase
LRTRLRKLNPGAEIHEVDRGNVDPAVFLRGGLYDPATKAPEVERWLNAEAHDEHAHEQAHERHDASVRSFSVYRDRPVRRAGLMLWLDMLGALRGANLLRVKGLLNVEGEPVVIQAVQSVIHEPVVLDAWPGADHRSRVVFITRDISREEVERTFDAFDFAPELSKARFDPALYAQFKHTMQSLTRGGAE